MNIKDDPPADGEPSVRCRENRTLKQKAGYPGLFMFQLQSGC
jgi:hypothetical protein